MKLMLATTLLLCSLGAFAGKRWEEKKAMRVEMLSKRIAMLTKAKSCFEAASTRDAFKACKQTLKSERSEIKQEAQSKRAAFKKNK